MSDQMTVHLLQVHHRHGADVTVHRTKESAVSDLMTYVDQWWDETGLSMDEMPADRDAAIDEYFENTDEWYELEEVPVQG